MELEPITAGPVPNQDRHGRLIAAWQLAQRSPNTARAYTRSMLDFCTWLDGRGLDLLEIKRPIVDGYRHVLDGAGAPATVAARLAALSSFYRYALTEDAIQRNPVELMARPKINPDHTETAGLSKHQAKTLLAVAQADGARSYALVAVLLYTGVRIGEALGATTADYAHDTGHRTLKIRRKGGEADRVAVPAPAVEALNAYLGTTGREVVSGVTGAGQPIFTTATGRPLAPSKAFLTVRRLARTAGIEGKISPHSLRHTFATLVFRRGFR